MAKTDIWMPIYIGDYLADTMHLTTEQHGAYLLLLITAWKMGGKLPNDADQLASIARMTPEKWSKTSRLLSAFFSLSEDYWIQERLLFEFEKSQRNRELKREAGRLGGRPKSKTKPNGKPKGKPIGLAKRKQNETPSPSDISLRDITPYSPPLEVDAQAWQDLDSYRANSKTKKIRESWTDVAKAKAASMLAAMTPDRQRACVDLTICNGWQGIFPDRINGNARHPTSRQSGDRKFDHEEYYQQTAEQLARSKAQDE